jgi:hypothetical protein
MKTSELIDALSGSAQPVTRLRPPVVRAAIWLLLAAAILGLLVVVSGLRPDLRLCLQRGDFVTAMAATLATAALAAVASFKLSLPDTPRGWGLLPLPALLVWVSTVGYGCLTDWVAMGPDGVHMGEAAQCFATLLLTSLPLSAALLVMLRHAAALRPTLVSVTGGLAVAAISSFVLALIHQFDATIMILIWNLGTAAAIAGVAAAFGRSTFKWIASRLPTP